MSGLPNPVPGWYADPADPASRLRFWDGTTWTDQTSSKFELEPPHWDDQLEDPHWDDQLEHPHWDQPGFLPGPGEGAFAEGPAFWPTPPGGTPALPAPGAPTFTGPDAPVFTGPGAPSLTAPGAPAFNVPGAPLGPPASAVPSWQSGPVPQGWQGGPVPPVWQGGPGPVYSPALPPPQVARKSRTGLIVGIVIAAAILVIGGLVAIALPTYNRITGNTWFNGGVPGWPIIRVTNFPSGGATLLEAWKVPGPTVGPSKPFLQIAKLKTEPAVGETATQYLSATLEYLRAHDPGSGGLVSIDDGAPGLEWTRPTPLANSPGLSITSFWLYAERGSSIYWLAFQTDSEDYASELPAVQAVMLKFKGTGQ